MKMQSNRSFRTKWPKIAVIAAVEDEISVVAGKMTLVRNTDAWQCGRILRGFIAETDLLIGWSSIGAVNMAHMITRLCIKNPHLKEIFLIGCGGSCSDNIDMLDIVVATEELYGDLGIKTKNGFYPLEKTGIPIACTKTDKIFNEIPVTGSHGKLFKFLELWGRENPGNIHKGRFVTVNSITGDSKTAKEIFLKWSPICESMEGAAAAHISLILGLNFTEIRCISNITGHYEKDEWRLPEAKLKVQELILNYLEFYSITNRADKQ